MQTMPTDGILERRGDTNVLRFERRLHHPVDRVWSALTEPAQLVKWLAQAELDPEQGGAIRLRWLNTGEAPPVVVTGTITRYDPPRVIEYDTDVHGRLTWQLRPDGDETVLTFTCSIDVPHDQLLMNLAGWHVHLDYLAQALEGHAQDWPTWSDDGWRRIHASYAARYGA